jgi:hypothetical protein
MLQVIDAVEQVEDEVHGAEVDIELPMEADDALYALENIGLKAGFVLLATGFNQLVFTETPNHDLRGPGTVGQFRQRDFPFHQSLFLLFAVIHDPLTGCVD